MEIINAIITSAVLDISERGFLDCWIHLDYGGTGQGFGGFALYLPKSYTHHKIESVAGHFIYRVMTVAGVGKWSELAGKTVRVQCEHSKVHAIGHIVNEDWFNPTEDFKNSKP
jgi:hypothetical protein